MNPIAQMSPLVKETSLSNLAVHCGRVEGREVLSRETFCSPVPSVYKHNFHLFHLLCVFISLELNISNDPCNKAVRV